jgi:putative transposase
MRTHYDKEFKAKVAIEAIKGEKIIQELATLYGVHPNLVALWKKQLQENASALFERAQKDKDKEAAQHKEEELFKEIGQLQVENEFLKEKVQTVVRDRTTMVEPKHPELSIRRQCVLLGISKRSYYYRPNARRTKHQNEVCMLGHILEVLKETPFASGKMILMSGGKEFLTYDGKMFFMSHGKMIFMSYGKMFFISDGKQFFT